MAGVEDADIKRGYHAPYSSKHPIPTISKYREAKAARQQDALSSHPYNDNADQSKAEQGASGQDRASHDHGEGANSGGNHQSQEDLKDTSQVDQSFNDLKQRRKQMKGRSAERAEREVTDPVTHLPVTIHDFTDEALKEIDVNELPFGSTKRTATGLDGKEKSNEELLDEAKDTQQQHYALANTFPPPSFDALRMEIASITKLGTGVSLAGAAIILFVGFAVDRIMRGNRYADAGGKATWAGTSLSLFILAATVGTVAVLVLGVREWSSKKMNDLFEDEVWEAQRRQTKSQANKNETETTAWLNSLLGSVWPLVNPDLFASLADTLEDVMQASLPKLVRMVSVEDIGQGSESLRILGIRWLPTGAASKAVGEDGSLSSKESYQNNSDVKETEDSNDSNEGEEAGGDQSVVKGMEAEEGDFVNLEVAFAYRSRASSKSLKERTKNMHLYLAFYLTGNIKVPVWVDLQGLVGTMRLRLQLTPDPPFFALCTLTFLGQPKVNLSCMPLSKHGLNIMDIPLISNFVQSAVDAAMAEYVAPKSLTLDLKDMLAGDDFKKDTTATGVLMINIKRGYDFKVGDTGIPLIKDGSSDPYVSVGWAKFGKVLWSTRILKSEMEPWWDETCFVLVTPEELNIDERIRIQLWDSDRFTADDDLGRIEVDLKGLMRNEQANGKMWNRADGFRALKSGDNMPGKLDWSIGYFSKTRIQNCQFEKQTHDPKIKNEKQLHQKVNESCERKLRETLIKGARSERDEDELAQQKTQEMKTEHDAMIISAPPPSDYPSGLFSLQIHNITGLAVDKLSKNTAGKDAEASDEEEAGEGMPSSYCTVIVNHKKTFKTRTKPQNAKPFFNAGCERFIRDWRDCEVFVSVRDARLHEDDALMGIVHLPLNEIFKERSQVMGFWPLTGGVGHGRIRISMVWRSVQLQAPSNLLGWQYGTVDVQPTALSSDCPKDIQSAKLKFKTNISSGKMYSSGGGGGRWQTRKERNLTLAVQNRYSSCVSISFKEKSLLGDGIAAFCVVWLKDLPDEEEQDLELPIWKGDFERGMTNCLEECGEKLGTLKLKLTFWAGMGSAHSRWASGNQDLRDVVEVIDTARDNLDTDTMEKHAGIVDFDVTTDSSSSDSDDDSDDDDDDKKDDVKKGSDIPDGTANHKQGPIDQVRDYKKKEKALHRQHRGIMQWKVPRTAKWVKHKWDKVEDSVQGMFDHQSKGGGIETEV